MSFSRPADPVIVSARRTAIGTAGHGFAALTTTSLAAPLLAEAALRVAPMDLDIDDVILGNCLGPGGDIARVASLAAGLSHQVPGVTVDRQCGSGLDAVMQAGSRIRAGDAALILAGGVEAASTSPWRFWPPTERSDMVRYTRAPFTPAGSPDPEMGASADSLATLLGISRSRQDEYAAHSHQRSWESVVGGVFTGEILEVAGVSTDARPRPGMTTGRLGRLRPAFGTAGTVTAGNSCGISDAAAVLALTTAERADGAGLAPVRIRGAAVAGDDPELPGLAIAAAVRKLFRSTRIDVTLADVGAVEITEAFASVALAAIDALELDPAIVCSDGGAIGLGHPWGASGAILLVRLCARMSRSGGARFGLAACAVGGGQGVAMLLERSPA